MYIFSYSHFYVLLNVRTKLGSLKAPRAHQQGAQTVRVSTCTGVHRWPPTTCIKTPDWTVRSRNSQSPLYARMERTVSPSCVARTARSITNNQCLEYFRDLPYPCHGQSSDEFSTYYNDKSKCLVLLQRGSGIGGYMAERSQFPHMALVGYGTERESAQWLCGGAVISERFILTAGHCSSTTKLGPVTFAGLGVLTRSELKDYWKIYKIKTVIKHPEYKPPMKYHDIALLQTETEINFGRSLLPACLDVGVTQTKFAEATGWGRLGHKGALAEHLMVMELEAYNETLCSELFPPHRLLKNGYDVKTQSCYGRPDKIVDTCQGDSGGPLHTAISDCVHFVFGVTSYGKDCGIPGNAGMYTRVSHYVPWIESIVWPDD